MVVGIIADPCTPTIISQRTRDREKTAIMRTPIDTIPEPLRAPVSLSQTVARPPRWYGWLLLLAAGPLLLLLLRLDPALDQHVLHNSLVHVLIAGGASFLGMMLALF